MLKPFISACAIALFLAASAHAQIQQTPGAEVTPPPRLPPNTPAPRLPCAPDLAVTSVTLTKGNLGQLSVTAEAHNVGRGEWVSNADFHNVSWYVHNRASGRRTNGSTPVPARVAQGALVAAVSTGVIHNAYSPVVPQTQIWVSVVHYPNILIDDLPCNDDRDASNNSVLLTVEQVRGFIRSTARTQTFRR
jgi:hypothetical protein